MASKERESTGMSQISSMYLDDGDDEMEDILDQTTTREEGVAMSPEAEASEIMGTAGIVGSEELHVENKFGPLEVASVEVQAEVNPLSKFLPPPPSTKCSDELQRRIHKFLELKRGGKSYNAEVRNKKEYRNPDFLVHAMTYQDIDQIGSCFNKDVFDPHGYDKSDFYDEIVVAASGLPSIPGSSSDGVGRDGRQSKNSKWDKVDNERRNPSINIRLLQ